MDPISALVDKTEELLGHSPHPAIVALPLGAWTVSNLCDGLALATGDDSFDDAAQISMGIGLLGAAGAIVTGIRDYSKIPQDRPSHDVATAHGLGNALVSSLFVASYIMRARASARNEPPGTLARVLALAGGGLSAYTGWLGGKLVSEYGEGVKPVMDQLSRAEDQEDSDHSTGRDRLQAGTPLGSLTV
ncbi:DUF2231 domain-containing protein [Isosphaeraceae bacterium EP7]